MTLSVYETLLELSDKRVAPLGSVKEGIFIWNILEMVKHIKKPAAVQEHKQRMSDTKHDYEPDSDV